MFKRKNTQRARKLRTKVKRQQLFCSITQNNSFPDVFAIDEVTMFEGDNHSDACYAVAGDILDGYLYDLFMNMLAERGVDADFADELSEWCSSHEHGQYINMLAELEKWSKL